MIKSKILLVLAIVVSTVLLYNLPRYVVNNTTQGINNETAVETDSGAFSHAPILRHDHSVQLPDSMETIFKRLYESFKNSDNLEKRLIFADSLTKAYKIVGKLDSMAKYIEIKAIEKPSLENFIFAGEGYYNAFNYEVDQTKRRYLAEKTQEYFTRVLKENSLLLDIKSKLAMTYVVGSNPMKGIMMLREVLEEDPNNELTVYNMGMLAINSGQLNKAIERFDKLKQLDPENPKAYFYLGYCFFELGKLDSAKINFQRVLELEISGEFSESSEEYLKRII